MNYLTENFWNARSGCIDGEQLWNAIQPHIQKGDLVVNHGKGEREGLVLVTYSKVYPYGRYGIAWEPLVEECRGIIFDTTNFYKIVALPFKKFFNYGEGSFHYPSAGSTISKIYTKEDGCCDADTIIATPNGDMTIKDIVDNKYTGDVYSYNIDKGLIETKQVIGHSVMRNNNDWYEIELEDGSIVKLTATHKVWIPNINAYRRVDQLLGDEEFLLKD